MKKLLLFFLFLVLLNAENPACPAMVTTPYDEFDITGGDRTNTIYDEPWTEEIDGAHAYRIEKGIYYQVTCAYCLKGEIYNPKTNQCDMDIFVEPCTDINSCRDYATPVIEDGETYLAFTIKKDCAKRTIEKINSTSKCFKEENKTDITPIIMPVDPEPNTNPSKAGGFTDNFGNPIQTYDNCPYGSIISEGDAILGCADAPTTPTNKDDLTKDYGIAPYGAPETENLDKDNNCPSGYRRDASRNNCVLVNERPDPNPTPHNIPINPNSPTPDNPYNPTPINPNNPPKNTPYNPNLDPNPNYPTNPYTILNNYYDSRNLSKYTDNRVINNDNKTLNTDSSTTNNDNKTLNTDSRVTNNDNKTINTDSSTTNNDNKTINNDNKVITYNIVNNEIGNKNDPNFGSTKDDPRDIALCNYPNNMFGVPFALVELKGLCTSAKHKANNIYSFECEDGINVACYFETNEQPKLNPVPNNPNPITPPPTPEDNKPNPITPPPTPEDNKPNPITPPPIPDNNKSNPIPALDNNKSLTKDDNSSLYDNLYNKFFDKKRSDELKKDRKLKLNLVETATDSALNTVSSGFLSITTIIDGFKPPISIHDYSCSLSVNVFGKDIDFKKGLDKIIILSGIVQLILGIASLYYLMRITILVFVDIKNSYMQMFGS